MQDNNCNFYCKIKFYLITINGHVDSAIKTLFSRLNFTKFVARIDFEYVSKLSLSTIVSNDGWIAYTLKSNQVTN